MQPKVPQYQPPPDDPQTLALKQQAERDRDAAGMDRARIDSASILARYGTRLSAASAGGGGPSAAGASPTMSTPPTDMTSLAALLLGKQFG